MEVVEFSSLRNKVEKIGAFRFSSVFIIRPKNQLVITESLQQIKHQDEKGLFFCELFDVSLPVFPICFNDWNHLRCREYDLAFQRLVFVCFVIMKYYKNQQKINLPKPILHKILDLVLK